MRTEQRRKEYLAISITRTSSFSCTPPYSRSFGYVYISIEPFVHLPHSHSLMMGHTEKDTESRSKWRWCGAWYSHNAAIVATFLTMSNGAGILISGIESFALGGRLLIEEAVIETLVGSTVIFISFLLLIILFSRLKVCSSHKTMY